jgi:resuscitation-promoting factor RpfB
LNLDFPPPLPDDTQPTSPLVKNLVPGCLRFVPLVVVIALAGTALVVVLLWLALMIVPGAREKPVTISVDGSAFPTITHAFTVGELLREQNITLDEGDVIVPAIQTAIKSDMIVSVTRARSVTLTVDGQSRVYRTHLTNPSEILNSAGLTLGEQDRVLIDGTEAEISSLQRWPVPVTQITVRRALRLRIMDGNTQRTILTTDDTVGDALFDADITLYLADSVSPDLYTGVTDNMEVTINRSRPVSIIADGITVETRVRGKTVADALAEAEIALVGLDYAIPDEDTALLPGIRIRIIRVSEEVIFEEIRQTFETVYQADSTLEIDQTQTLQAGQEGITQTSVRVRYENGVEISRTTEETAVAQEAVNHIIGYGTNIVLRTIDTPNGPRQYWRRLRMYATSYHPAALGGDNVTATGKTLTKGIVGSDPRVIAYGNQLYVPGYGEGVMADTGGARPGLWIDLGYDDANWVGWSRWVDVYLLAPVPDNIRYLLP